MGLHEVAKLQKRFPGKCREDVGLLHFELGFNHLDSEAQRGRH